jgi:hypothetical protein
MRKILYSLSFVALMTASSFAVSGPQNAVALDILPASMGLILGGFWVNLSFERAFSDNFSGILKFGYIDLNYTLGTTARITGIYPGIEGRYYFSSTALTGFFSGIGVSYNIYSTATLVDLDIGYKWVIGGPASGFLIEPFVGYGLSIPAQNNEAVNGISEVGLKLGYAF